jgi:hypothetical protein
MIRLITDSKSNKILSVENVLLAENQHIFWVDLIQIFNLIRCVLCSNRKLTFSLIKVTNWRFYLFSTEEIMFDFESVNKGIMPHVFH